MNEPQFKDKIFIVAEYNPKFTDMVLHGFSLMNFLVVESIFQNNLITLLSSSNTLKENIIVLNNPFTENVDVLEFERIFAPKIQNIFIGFFMGSHTSEEYKYHVNLKNNELFTFSYEFFLKEKECNNDLIMYILNDFMLEFKKMITGRHLYE